MGGSAVAADKHRGRSALQRLRHRFGRTGRPSGAEQRQKHGAEPREHEWAHPLGRGEEATLAVRRRGDSNLTACPAENKDGSETVKMPCGGPREGTGRKTELFNSLSHTHTHSHTRYIHTCAHTHICSHTCAHTHTVTHTLTHTRLYTHAHTYTQTHTHMLTHTHTHTLTLQIGLGISWRSANQQDSRENC